MDLFEYSAHEHSRSQASKARDEGIAKHSRKPQGAEWIKRAREVAKMLAAKNGSVTCDDVRATIGDHPAESDSRIFGAIFREKGWRRIGYEPSVRIVNHGRPVARFEWRGEL